MNTISIKIQNGVGIGGVKPYVVVCFDQDMKNKLYKSAPAPGGKISRWNEKFSLDLVSEIYTVLNKGHPEPQALTFNILDASSAGHVSLGSSEVSLAAVRKNGYVEGDFPISNGTGVLSLFVGQEPKQSWLKSDTAKTVGVLGAVGVVALGLTVRHFHKKKQSTRQTGSARTLQRPFN